MLRPKATLSSVLEISPYWLRERGLRGLLLDLDNTLVPYKTYAEPSVHLQYWMGQLKKAGIRVVLVSNAMPKRVEYWSAKLGVEGYGPAGKPWLGFRRGVRQLGLKPWEIAVVGDQLFTDVLGGNLVGAYTVLVQPLSQNEMGYTRLVRKLERMVMGSLRVSTKK